MRSTMSDNDSQKVADHKNSKQPEHRDLYHYVYVFGGSVGVGVVDFVFIWPDHHLLALLIAAAWFSPIAIFELRDFRPEWRVTVPVFLFMGALIANFIIDALTPLPERIITGTLQPASDPRPQTGCDPMGPDAYWSPFGGFIRFKVQRHKEPPPADAIVVTLGSNGIIVTKNEKVPIVQIADCTLLSIQKTSNGLLVNASVFDLQGKLEAFIRDNAFTAIERGTFPPQPGDLSTMEVRDQNIERHWENFGNQKTVKEGGIFFCHTSYPKGK